MDKLTVEVRMNGDEFEPAELHRIGLESCDVKYASDDFQMTVETARVYLCIGDIFALGQAALAAAKIGPKGV